MLLFWHSNHSYNRWGTLDSCMLTPSRYFIAFHTIPLILEPSYYCCTFCNSYIIPFNLQKRIFQSNLKGVYALCQTYFLSILHLHPTSMQLHIKKKKFKGGLLVQPADLFKKLYSINFADDSVPANTIVKKMDVGKYQKFFVSPDHYRGRLYFSAVQA